MLKVYLAAPYVMKDVIQERATELRVVGIEITSSWINEKHKPTVQMHEITKEEHQQYALQDIQDVVAADILVFHTDPTKTIVRGGRHVEFGIAIGIGLTRHMPILVVGQDHENIFHYLPQVTHWDSWDQVKKALCDIHTWDEISSRA
jgi:nucleoside 2-deoxyribosyltransferase